ncbi:MAG: M48 family metalloprotease [Flavobacterium sp.]|nr:M48 family metalloprotease [Flavobacterium sp.]
MKIILFFLLSTVSAYSQIYYCSYSGGSCDSGILPPSPLAQNVVFDICNTLSIPPIAIYESNVPDACAYGDKFGNKIISYNANFLNYLFNNNNWASISVLAHEVGHHYAMHSTWYGTFLHPWSKELQADYVSGYVLYKLGCPSIDNALSAMKLMFTYVGTNSHPDSPKRMDALAQGYIRASKGY